MRHQFDKVRSEKATRPSSTSATPKRTARIKLLAGLLTLFGAGLFAYIVYSVGLGDIVDGVVRFGWLGFAIILAIYFVRICVRALAWRLSVHPPYELGIRDTIPAVIIGEALSSTIPLGILISGTSKAVVVRHRIPLVAGLSSVATENLFYSLITGLFLISGAVLLLTTLSLDAGVTVPLYVMISGLMVLIMLGISMVVRQWHIASSICEIVYRRGWLARILENGRAEVRQFEDLIYGFYRHYPGRFVPICLLEVAYHALGIAEVWFILARVSQEVPGLSAAFLLESASRLITVVFKLVPFMLGVDEAGAQIVGEAVALGAGVAVTLAIIRKGRILFWSVLGAMLIAKRGLRLTELQGTTSE